MNVTKPIRILNLVNEFEENLESYFSQDRFEVVDRENLDDYESIDFVLVGSSSEAKEVAIDFNVEKNKFKIICIGPVDSTKEFLVSNGRLHFSQNIANTSFGKSVLNKFFFDEHSIHLAGTYGDEFDKTTDFAITNPLMAGESTDRMCYDAYESGFNIIGLRSFMDHALYYLSYLKQSKLAGLPFEFEFGKNENCFALNIHVSVKNFYFEYLYESFGEVNSNSPLKYLLSIMEGASDFLDITYVEKPSKIVFTAIWSKDTENRIQGLSLNNILTTHEVTRQIENQYDEYVPEKELSGELTEQIKLPGNLNTLNTKLSSDSILNVDIDLEAIFSFSKERYEKKYPDSSKATITTNTLESLLKGFENQDVIDKLTSNDIEFLLERLQKDDLLKSINAEVDIARDRFNEDDDFKTQLSDSKIENIATEVAENIDSDAISSLVSSLAEDDDFNTAISSLDDDPEDDINISGGTEDDDEGLINISGSQDDDDEITKVTGSDLEVDDDSINISGSGDEKDDITKISGSDLEVEDDSITISGGSEDSKEFMTSISGMKDEKENPFTAHFQNSLVEKDANMTGRSGHTDAKALSAFVVKSLNEADIKPVSKTVTAFVKAEAPKKLELAIESFAKDKGLPVSELTNSDLSEFSKNDVPSIMDEILNNDEDIAAFEKSLSTSDSIAIKEKQTPDDFKQRFKNNLEEKTKEDITTLSSAEMKEALVTTVKESLLEVADDKKITIEEKVIKEKELIQDISKSLGVDESDVDSIVKAANDKSNELEAIVIKEKISDEEDNNSSSGFDALAQVQMMQKLKQMEAENQTLRNNIQALNLTREAKAKADKNFELIQEKISLNEDEIQTIKGDDSLVDEDEVTIVKEHISEDEKKDLLLKVHSNDELEASDKDKLNSVFDTSRGLINEMKKESDANIRKLELEAQKRNNIFKSEMNRMEKMMHAKNLVVTKAKESMKTLVSKKQGEIGSLKTQVNSLSQKLKDDKSTMLESQLRAVVKDKAIQERTVELYKGKLETMAKSLDKNKKQENTAQMSEENRNLKRAKSMLERKNEESSRAQKKLEEKYQQVAGADIKLKTDLKKSQGEHKVAQGIIKGLKEKQAAFEDNAKKRGAEKSNLIQKDLDHQKNQNNKLQTKLRELQLKVKATGPTETKKVDEKSIEAAVAKKYDAKIDKSAREVEQQRSQNKQLQAKIKEITEKFKKGETGADGKPASTNPKTKQLEQSVKKLNTDLSKSKTESAELKKDSIKAKKEVIGLKNQLTAMKKELEKAKKSASPKSKKAA